MTDKTLAQVIARDVVHRDMGTYPLDESYTIETQYNPTSGLYNIPQLNLLWNKQPVYATRFRQLRFDITQYSIYGDIWSYIDRSRNMMSHLNEDGRLLADMGFHIARIYNVVGYTRQFRDCLVFIYPKAKIDIGEVFIQGDRRYSWQFVKMTDTEVICGYRSYVERVRDALLEVVHGEAYGMSELHMSENPSEYYYEFFPTEVVDQLIQKV